MRNTGRCDLGACALTFVLLITGVPGIMCWGDLVVDINNSGSHLKELKWKILVAGEESRGSVARDAAEIAAEPLLPGS